MERRCSLYEALSAEESGEVQVKLFEMSKLDGRLQRTVAAIEADARVEQTHWRDFAALVRATDLSDMPRALRNWARKHLLSGPVSDWRRPLVRVTGYEAFLVAFMDSTAAAGNVITRDIAIEIVEGLTGTPDWTTARDRAAALGADLGRHVIWATFSDDGSDPLGPSLGATAIASQLGFDDGVALGVAVGDDIPLLLLSYLEDDLEPRFPTSLEALASDPLNYYFSPAPAGASWGLTQPWPNAPGSAHGRPEVVHEPVGVAALKEPIALVFP